MCGYLGLRGAAHLVGLRAETAAGRHLLYKLLRTGDRLPLREVLVLLTQVFTGLPALVPAAIAVERAIRLGDELQQMVDFQSRHGIGWRRRDGDWQEREE